MDKYFDQNENWNYLGEPIYKKDLNNFITDESYDDNAVVSDSKKDRKQITILSPVIAFQLIVCILVLISAFLSNTFINTEFRNLKEEYDQELYATMFFDGKLKDLDYSPLFNSQSEDK